MKAILVIRKNGKFNRILEANGFEAINLPLIETKVLDDLSDFEEKLSKIEYYNGIFITSRCAAQIFAENLNRKKAGFNGKVYVFGNRIYEILKTENLNLVHSESANTAQEMLEEIAAEDLKDKRFLFVRGEKSLRIVPGFLTKTATVDEVIVYKTLNVEVKADESNCLREKFKKKEILCACFFSPSAAEGFIEQFGAKILHQTCIATIGKTTAEYLERQSVKVGFVSSKSNAEKFATELIKYLREEI